MRYKVTWYYFWDSMSVPERTETVIVEATTASKARYAAYKQIFPNRDYEFGWFLNEIEVETLKEESKE